MCNFFIFLILLNSSLTFSDNGVLVAVPGLSEFDYQEILSERKDLLSPMQRLLQDYNKQEANPIIFSLADQCLIKKQCHSLAKNFE